MTKEIETDVHTKSIETTGHYPPVSQIQPVMNITPTQPETVGQKMAGQLGLGFGVAAVTYLTSLAMQHYLTGVTIIAIMVLPLELTRRVLAIVQTRVGTTTAVAAGAAIVATAAKAQNIAAMGLAVVVGLAACLGGCSAIARWDREPCVDVQSWTCINDQPHYCSAETPPKWTPSGSEPCSASGRTCAHTDPSNSHSRAYCSGGR